MKNWRIVLLALVALGLLVLAICTWGSVGSAVCAFCLITMAAALIFKRFLLREGDNDFWEDQNG